MVPADQVLRNAQYRPEMQSVDVPHQIYAHIAGIGNFSQLMLMKLNRVVAIAFFYFNYTPGALPISPAGKILREFFEHTYMRRPMASPAEEPADEYPYTLNLR